MVIFAEWVFFVFEQCQTVERIMKVLRALDLESEVGQKVVVSAGRAKDVAKEIWCTATKSCVSFVGRRWRFGEMMAG